MTGVPDINTCSLDCARVRDQDLALDQRPSPSISLDLGGQLAVLIHLLLTTLTSPDLPLPPAHNPSCGVQTKGRVWIHGPVAAVGCRDGHGVCSHWGHWKHAVLSRPHPSLALVSPAPWWVSSQVSPPFSGELKSTLGKDDPTPHLGITVELTLWTRAQMIQP